MERHKQLAESGHGRYDEVMDEYKVRDTTMYVNLYSILDPDITTAQKQGAFVRGTLLPYQLQAL